MKLVERGAKAAKAVQSGMGEIQRLLGSVAEWDVPGPDRFASGIALRFEEIGDLVLRVGLTHDHTLAALDRVVRGERPTVGNKEEFRDQLVWQSVLDLGRHGYNVIFVSNDGGFYESGNVGGPLAPILQNDIDGLMVRVVPTLEECLDIVDRVAPHIDRDALIEALVSYTSTVLTEVADNQGLQLADVRDSCIKVYATERPEIVSVVFRLEREVRGDDKDGMSSPFSYIEGTAFFDPATGTVTECRPEKYGLRWLDEHGTEVGTQNVVLGLASITFGASEVPWTVARELPNT